MSRAAKLTLAGTSLFAAGTIVFVHYAQKAEKAVGSHSLPLCMIDFHLLLRWPLDTGAKMLTIL